MLGLVIFLLMMATAFMGYVLPWGQMSFWGAKVITGLFGAIPLVGEPIQQLAARRLRARPADAEPLLLAPLSAAVRDRRRGHPPHLGAAHSGLGQPDRGRRQERRRTPCPSIPITPPRTASALGVFLILLAIVIFFAPNYLGHADNYIPANPLSTPAHIVPEWYFWPFYAILRAFTVDFILPAKLWGVLAMFALDPAALLPALARPVAGPLGQLPAALPPVLLDPDRSTSWCSAGAAGCRRKSPM